MTKTVGILIALMVVFGWAGAQASVRHCGQLTSVALVSDNASLVRMSLFDSKRHPSYVTIKEIRSIVEAIRVISGKPKYLHQSNKDNYDWSQLDTGDRYFVCIISEKFRSISGRYFLDTTSELMIWKNKKLVFQRSQPPLKDQQISQVQASAKNSATDLKKAL